MPNSATFPIFAVFILFYTTFKFTLATSIACSKKFRVLVPVTFLPVVFSNSPATDFRWYFFMAPSTIMPIQ
jgi:hypothetical protein